MSSWEFPGSDPIEIHVDIAAGSVAISAEPAEVTTVSLLPSGHGSNDDRLVSDVQVSFSHGRLEIIQPKRAGFLRGRSGLDLTVKAPAGSQAIVRTASADVVCVGELAELDAKTASGDLTAASVTGPLEVKTASGDVWLEHAGTAVQVHTASGDVRLREAGGDISVDSASGDVSIGTAGASVRAQTASGDVRISKVTAGQADVKTVSGDCSVGVAQGTGVYLDLSSLSGQIKNLLDETGETGDVSLQVTCRSVSGDIRITRADAH
jgi:DUF4097 and DUF4098 domain-containing protein YvlB